jgi:hypothetical protein
VAFRSLSLSPIREDSISQAMSVENSLKPELVDKFRKVISTVITQAMISESKENIEDLEHFQSIFNTMRKVAVCLDSLNIIVRSVMTPNFNRAWREGFTQFKNSFTRLSIKDYLKLHPRNMNQSLTVPKVRVVSEEMPQWIEEILYCVSDKRLKQLIPTTLGWSPIFDW